MCKSYGVACDLEWSRNRLKTDVRDRI